MSGQSFKTTLPEMDQTSKRVVTIAETIDAEMKKLDEQIQILGPVWQGAASASMKVLHQTWMDKQAKLNLVLRDVAEGIKSNGIAYNNVETDITSVMTQTTGLFA